MNEPQSPKISVRTAPKQATAPAGVDNEVSETGSSEEQRVCVAALGDLMLAGEWDGVSQVGSMASALGTLREVVASDLVFANLEATAPGEGETISKEPRLIGQSRTLKQALETLGVDLVSLANNHTFDACLGGFREVCDVLDELAVEHLGAGESAKEASRWRILECAGLRFGWLAYNHEETRPSHVAGADSFGVNPLEEVRALREIEELSRDCDHVIVSVHWGVEYCHVPSPASIKQARAFVDAGASLIIGHHAHVVQGAEVYGSGVIAYNLGNAVTTDLEIGGQLAIGQSSKTRSSYAVRATFSTERLVHVELVPFYAGHGQVTLEHREPLRRLESANRRLAAGVSEKQWKRTRLLEDVVLRTFKKLHPRVIRSIRPRHFAKFFKNIAGAVGGRGPAA